VSSAERGVLTVDAATTCAEVEARAAPWLFASDRPDLTVGEWIDRGGGDLLWGLLGPTRAQVLGLVAELPDGTRVRCGGRVVKNVAGYDLARVFVGARGALGRVVEAHLRVRPAPRGWRAAVRRDAPREHAREGPGCAVWAAGDCWRFLRRGEPTPPGYAERDPLEARATLRAAWRGVHSFGPADGDGILLAPPGVTGLATAPAPDRGPLWERLVRAWS